MGRSRFWIDWLLLRSKHGDAVDRSGPRLPRLRKHLQGAEKTDEGGIESASE